MSDVQGTATVEILPDLSEFDEDVRRQLPESLAAVERSAATTATNIERSFTDAATELGQSFDRIEGDAKTSADRVEGHYETAAKDIRGEFDRPLQGDAFDRIGSDAEQAARDLDEKFERALSGLGEDAQREMRQVRDEIRLAAESVDTQLPSSLEHAEASVREFGAVSDEQFARVREQARLTDESIDRIGTEGGVGGGGAAGFGQSIAAKAAVAVVALQQVIQVGEQAAQAAIEVQQIDNATAQLLANAGGASGETAESIEHLSTSLSDLAAIDDDDIQAGLNVLLRFQGIGPEIFEPAAQAMVDVSAVMGTALPAAAQTLGRALENPTTALSKLGRAGLLEATPQLRETIQTLVDAGDTAGAQGAIIEAVLGRVGGAAAANASPIDRLGIGLGNLQEALGAGIVSGLDAIGGEAGSLFDELEPKAEDLGELIGKLIETLGPPTFQVVDLFLDLFGAVEPLLPALLLILDPIVALGNVVAAVEGPLGKFGDVLDRVASIAGTVGHALESIPGVTAAMGAAGDALHLMFGGVDTEGEKAVGRVGDLTEQTYALGTALQAGPLTNLQLLAANVPNVADAINEVLNAPTGGTAAGLYDLSVAADAAQLSGEDLDATAQALGVSTSALTAFLQGTTAAVDSMTSAVEGNLPKLSEFGTGLDEASHAFDLEDFESDLAQALVDMQSFTTNLQSLPPALQQIGAQMGPAAAAAFAAMAPEARDALNTTAGEFLTAEDQIPQIVSDMYGDAAAESAAGGANMTRALDSNLDLTTVTTLELAEAIKTVSNNRPGLAAAAQQLGAAGGAGWRAGLEGSVPEGTEAAFEAVRAQLQSNVNIPEAAREIGFNAGAALGAGTAEGVRESIAELNAAIDDVFGEAQTHAKLKMKIFSPSRVMADEIGRPLGQGIAVGILETQKEVSDAMAVLAGQAADQNDPRLRAALARVQGFAVSIANTDVSDAAAALIEQAKGDRIRHAVFDFANRGLTGAQIGNETIDRLARAAGAGGGALPSSGVASGGSSTSATGASVIIQGVPNMIVVQVNGGPAGLDPGQGLVLGRQVLDAIQTVAGRQEAVTAQLVGVGA